MSDPVFAFDPNRPPSMPVSALLYCPTFMRVVCQQAPSMIYGLGRDARRDARQTALWLHWAIVRWHCCVRWLEMNPSPFRVVPEQLSRSEMFKRASQR